MSRTRLVLAAVAAGGLLIAAGCSSDDNPAEAQTIGKQTGKSSSQKSSRQQVTAGQLKAAVGKLVLSAGDVGHDVAVQDQDASLEAPTNDICAKKWGSDGQRLARRQDFFWQESAAGELVVSNEAVAYQPGKGVDVLDEIEFAVDDCDGWDHPQGAIKDVRPVDPPKGSLKAAFSWEGEDDRDNQDYSYVAVYQAKGDLLSALYVWAEDLDDAREVADELAPKAAERLEKAVG